MARGGRVGGGGGGCPTGGGFSALLRKESGSGFIIFREKRGVFFL